MSTTYPGHPLVLDQPPRMGGGLRARRRAPGTRPSSTVVLTRTPGFHVRTLLAIARGLTPPSFDTDAYGIVHTVDADGAGQGSPQYMVTSSTVPFM
jgi:hypothetical protein